MAAQSIIQQSRIPSWYMPLAKWSGGATSGTIVNSDGGVCVAVHHCVQPMYDGPVMPTLPSHHACLASHSTRSYPSVLCLGPNGSHVPSESYRPRTSEMATAYPRRANHLA